MFDEKEQATELKVSVREAWIGLQLLDKAAGNGVIQSNEFALMGEWRSVLVEAIKGAIDKDYDEEMLKLRIAREKAIQEARAKMQEDTTVEAAE